METFLKVYCLGKSRNGDRCLKILRVITLFTIVIKFPQTLKILPKNFENIHQYHHTQPDECIPTVAGGYQGRLMSTDSDKWLPTATDHY